MKRLISTLALCLGITLATAQQTVPQDVMERVYHEVKTPHKYGLVILPPRAGSMIDSPTIFRHGDTWYMTYIIFDGRGYETWLATSPDLLEWQTEGKIMSYDDSRWDKNQVAGYPALIEAKWGGKYRYRSYGGRHWMSYLGGDTRGYEAGVLSVGMAHTEQAPWRVHEWQRADTPVLRSNDADAGWWEGVTIYKSGVIEDKRRLTGSRFVMYYNAKGENPPQHPQAERIGIAFSDDMLNWRRHTANPVLDHGKGITGDAYLQQMGDVWVMFYFGAFWGDYPGGAFNHFACSYDLVHWTDWTGAHLIEPSEPFDAKYAHKSCVVKWQGVVYHFYCAVDAQGRRSIAVATSKDLGRSALSFGGE